MSGGSFLLTASPETAEPPHAPSLIRGSMFLYAGRATELIKPLVGGIKRRDRNVDYLQFAHSPMTALRLDVYRGHRFNGKQLSVEFHLPFTLQNDVDLGHPFVVVRSGIGMDINHMHAGQISFKPTETTPGIPARTPYWRYLVQVTDVKIRHQA